MVEFVSAGFFLDLFYYSCSDSKGLRIDLKTPIPSQIKKIIANQFDAVWEQR